jgi:5-deoxy-glucuronate isomerase
MLLVRSSEHQISGYQEIITPHQQPLRWLRFGLIRLTPSTMTVSRTTAHYEAALVILRGVVDVTVDGRTWPNLGARDDVFDGLATTVYVPRDAQYQVAAKPGGADIAVCEALADQRHQPFVIDPDQVQVTQRGRDRWRREVRDILVAGYDDRVDRLVVGETINEPGEWSGYPPHKHDHASTEESVFEEIYHYRVRPAQGFGVQLHYGSRVEPHDAAYIVRDGDTFAIPDGYHPLSAAGGYQVYYLWCMAGPFGRGLRPYEDPQHRWVHRAE